MARPVRAGALVAAVLAGACCAGGCARPGPPGGGPVDTTAPSIISTSPSDGDIGVPRDAPIEIRFSEEMDRDATWRALSIAPDVALGGARWSAGTMTVAPPAGLPDSTTLVVSVGIGARDLHGVAMAGPSAFAFSTGTTLDDGIVSGRVVSDGSAAAGALVWLVRGAARPDSAGVFEGSARRTAAGPDGAFRLTRVAASPLPYSLVAFVDADRDGRFDPATEAGAVLDRAAGIRAPADSVVGIAVEIAPPPGGREGE